MNSLLAQIGSGFDEPVQHAQAVFRTLLDAMSRPGHVLALPAPALAGLQRPHDDDGQPLGAALIAMLLTVLDAETTLYLGPRFGSDAADAYARFHTGCRRVALPAQAGFSAVTAAELDAALWHTLPEGSDEQPQDGATLLVEVPGLAATPLPHAACLQLRGPGIQHAHTLAVQGIAAEVWRARIAAQPDYPRGVDMVLCCGERIAALPRSTRITLEG